MSSALIDQVTIFRPYPIPNRGELSVSRRDSNIFGYCWASVSKIDIEKRSDRTYTRSCAALTRDKRGMIRMALFVIKVEPLVPFML